MMKNEGKVPEMEGLTVKETNDFIEKFKQTDRASREWLLKALFEFHNEQEKGLEQAGGK